MSTQCLKTASLNTGVRPPSLFFLSRPRAALTLALFPECGARERNGFFRGLFVLLGFSVPLGFWDGAPSLKLRIEGLAIYAGICGFVSDMLGWRSSYAESKTTAAVKGEIKGAGLQPRPPCAPGQSRGTGLFLLVALKPLSPKPETLNPEPPTQHKPLKAKDLERQRWT